MDSQIKRILLVEDSEKDLELTLVALDELRIANEVVTVRDGEEALNYLYRRGQFSYRPEGNPAAVLLDLKMPKVDGIEVLKTIKADAKLKNIPVIMLTSSREEKDLVDSYDLGVNAYVVKPVRFDEFLDAVKKLGTFWALSNEAPPGTIPKVP
jgi:CheY-like chemotaxis protein